MSERVAEGRFSVSASVWDRAVEAAARATVMAQSNGCCDQWPKPCADCDCFRDQRPDVMAGYERAHAHAALAAAVPVLLEELADALQASDIEKAGPGCCNWDFGSNVKNKAVRIVRGFAAEVTQ